MRLPHRAVVATLYWALSPSVLYAAPDVACSSRSTAPSNPTGESIIELIKPLPLETKWIDLPDSMRARLRVLADNRLAAYRSNWSADALASKQALLLNNPTPKMKAAMDRYYRTAYQTILPATFSVSEIKEPLLANALVRNYLGTFAAARATLTYPDATLPNCDWDGESLFDSIRLPDKQTSDDINAYNQRVVADLKSIDDSSLGELEAKLKEYLLFTARSNAEGSAGDSFGDDFLEQACGLARLNYDILAGYESDHGRPKMFTSDEDVVREANALYLHNTELKWFDVGTRGSALSYCATTRDRIYKDIGDPATSDAAKGIILLQNWWTERTQNAPAQKCSIYSVEDRARVWDAFSADQQFNNDGSSSIETYHGHLERYKADKIGHYRQAALAAMKLIFPDDSVLTASERARVVAAVAGRTDFGSFIVSIPGELDAAQGTTNGAAARLWTSTVAGNVEYIGGYSPGEILRPSEVEELRVMFEEVKSWIARNYSGYPIKIGPLLDHIELEVDTRDNAFTENGTAKIFIGIGTKRSKAEYYSWLLHELRHAVMYAWHAAAPDKSRLKNDEGPALEGSGAAVEDLLLQSFLKQTLRNEIALALYSLDYGIRDARFAGTTDATLQKYLRANCSDPSDDDTVEFVRKIAISYGLVGKRADTVVQRAHAGTQYLQYIWGGLYMLDEIAFLQTQVDPSKQLRVDPFVLFACELNTPRRDNAYIEALKTCIRH